MALAPGVRLGPYAIVSALGAGGMGEAYCGVVTAFYGRLLWALSS